MFKLYLLIHYSRNRNIALIFLTVKRQNGKNNQINSSPHTRGRRGYQLFSNELILK